MFFRWWIIGTTRILNACNEVEWKCDENVDGIERKYKISKGPQAVQRHKSEKQYHLHNTHIVFAFSVMVLALAAFIQNYCFHAENRVFYGSFRIASDVDITESVLCIQYCYKLLHHAYKLEVLYDVPKK